MAYLAAPVSEQGPRPISAPPDSISLQPPSTVPRSLSMNSPASTSVVDRDKLFESWPRKSAHVVEELISTERTYLQALDDVITVSGACYIII